jgi:hypothetical protein
MYAICKHVKTPQQQDYVIGLNKSLLHDQTDNSRNFNNSARSDTWKRSIDGAGGSLHLSTTETWMPTAAEDSTALSVNANDSDIYIEDSNNTWQSTTKPLVSSVNEQVMELSTLGDNSDIDESGSGEIATQFINITSYGNTWTNDMLSSINEWKNSTDVMVTATLFDDVGKNDAVNSHTSTRF